MWGVEDCEGFFAVGGGVKGGLRGGCGGGGGVGVGPRAGSETWWDCGRSGGRGVGLIGGFGVEGGFPWGGRGSWSAFGCSGAEREASLFRLRVSREADFDCRSLGWVGAVDGRGLWWLRSSVRLTDSRFSALRIEPGER